jgi:hypothetical protein
LVAHDDAGNDAHTESDGENLEPIEIQTQVLLVAILEPHTLEIEKSKVACKTDRECGKKNVKCECEDKLQPRQHDRVESRLHL